MHNPCPWSLKVTTSPPQKPRFSFSFLGLEKLGVLLAIPHYKLVQTTSRPGMCTRIRPHFYLIPSRGEYYEVAISDYGGSLGFAVPRHASRARVIYKRRCRVMRDAPWKRFFRRDQTTPTPPEASKETRCPEWIDNELLPITCCDKIVSSNSTGINIVAQDY